MEKKFISEDLTGIYSFPKSGNTWVRYFINSLFEFGDVSKICPDMYANGLPKIHGNLNGESFSFYKAHSKKINSKFHGVPLTHKAVIYIIRNPLDVFLSYLNYMLRIADNSSYSIKYNSFEDVIAQDDIDLFFKSFCLFGTIDPKFIDAGSWIENVDYWLFGKHDFPVIVLRYEKMLEDPFNEFSKLGELLNFSDDDLKRSLSTADEKTQIDGNFFWKRNHGGYKEYLSDYQIKYFKGKHYNILEKTGYLNLL